MDLSDVLRQVADNLSQPKPETEPVSESAYMSKMEGIDEIMEATHFRFDASKPEMSASRKQKRVARVELAHRTLQELLPELPPPDVAIDILSNANLAGKNRLFFHFGAMIERVINLVSPDGGANVYISTWTINHEGAEQLVALMSDDRISRLILCMDRSLVSRYPHTAHLLATSMHQTRHMYLSFHNHSKVVCISNPDQTRVVTITGSGNLSSQPRIEQYTISTAPEPYNLYVTHLFNWAIAQWEAQHDGNEG